jgi:putative membrane protein
MKPFLHNKILQALALWLVVFWGLMAIAPLDRHDWFLENILVFVGTGYVLLTYRFLQLSNLSYFLVITFLTLHITGAHYTYSAVPFGYDLAKMFDMERNHFDRIVHFSFGLLLAYPIFETLRRFAGIKGWLSYYLPIDIVMACSGLFEIIEWAVVEIVNPELGMAYLGTQGDIWDAQKDMALAALGSILAMLGTAFILRWCHNGHSKP